MNPIAGSDIAIPPDLKARIQAAAAAERRSATDVVRDAVELYLAGQSENGMGNDTLITPEYGQTIRESIAQGLACARAGQLVDGEAVFARIHAELDEAERLGQQ